VYSLILAPNYISVWYFVHLQRFTIARDDRKEMRVEKTTLGFSMSWTHIQSIMTSTLFTVSVTEEHKSWSHLLHFLKHLFSNVTLCVTHLQPILSSVAQTSIYEVTYLLIESLQLVVVKQFIRICNVDSHRFRFLQPLLPVGMNQVACETLCFCSSCSTQDYARKLTLFILISLRIMEGSTLN